MAAREKPSSKAAYRSPVETGLDWTGWLGRQDSKLGIPNDRDQNSRMQKPSFSVSRAVRSLRNAAQLHERCDLICPDLPKVL
jgi:hypothetical protein